MKPKNIPDPISGIKVPYHSDSGAPDPAVEQPVFTLSNKGKGYNGYMRLLIDQGSTTVDHVGFDFNVHEAVQLVEALLTVIANMRDRGEAR